MCILKRSVQVWCYLRRHLRATLLAVVREDYRRHSSERLGPAAGREGEGRTWGGGDSDRGTGTGTGAGGVRRGRRGKGNLGRVAGYIQVQAEAMFPETDPERYEKSGTIVALRVTSLRANSY